MLGKLKSLILSNLALPASNDVCLDSPEASLKHWQIIREKPFLYQIYSEWYRQIAASLPKGPKPVLEIGSGGGFMRDHVETLITTDIMSLPHLDMALDACAEFPFEDGSLRGIAMVNTFHHLPNAEKFLAEASRCLEPGGAIVMLEPWVTTWASLIYSNLHHEPFAPKVSKWEFESHGPLSSANGALPWIVFSRDKQKFASLFPDLKIEKTQVTMPLRYLLSGGVSMRNLVPDASFHFWVGVEKLMSPLMSQLGMFAFIVVRKSPQNVEKTNSQKSFAVHS